MVVAIEQTGTYHQPVKRAFEAAGLECRIVHPLASKPFRQAAHPGVKTDDNDLAGIFSAAAMGFGLMEPALDPQDRQLRLWVRSRRDLVEKRSLLCRQLKEHWQASAMPRRNVNDGNRRHLRPTEQIEEIFRRAMPPATPARRGGDRDSRRQLSHEGQTRQLTSPWPHFGHGNFAVAPVGEWSDR
jgi:transposase